jgi:glycosyltransferase involved in cell wall biosynthesis
VSTSDADPQILVGSGAELIVRVLHLIPALTGGGAERQLALLSRALPRVGVDTHIGFVREGPNLDFAIRPGGTLHRIRCLGNHDPLILGRTNQLIRKLRPQVVQTWLTQMDVFGGLAARITRVPFILSERASGLSYPASWKNSLRVNIGRRADMVVTNSQAGMDYWSAFVPKERIAVVRNGLPASIWEPCAPADLTSMGLPRDARLVLYAGRLTAIKNLDTLVQAVDQVLGERTDTVALLFGDGELRECLGTRIARARNASRIRLAGYTKEPWSWMRRASAFVSLSWSEGNPNAVIEAMAHGCPLVVSDIPAHREFLDNSTALLCNPHSPREVAISILHTLDAPIAAAKRAEAARRRSEGWLIERSADRYAEIYKRLAG